MTKKLKFTEDNKVITLGGNWVTKTQFPKTCAIDGDENYYVTARESSTNHTALFRSTDFITWTKLNDTDNFAGLLSETDSRYGKVLTYGDTIVYCAVILDDVLWVTLFTAISDDCGGTWTTGDCGHLSNVFYGLSDVFLGFYIPLFTRVYRFYYVLYTTQITDTIDVFYQEVTPGSTITALVTDEALGGGTTIDSMSAGFFHYNTIYTSLYYYFTTLSGSVSTIWKMEVFSGSISSAMSNVNLVSDDYTSALIMNESGTFYLICQNDLWVNKSRFSSSIPANISNKWVRVFDSMTYTYSFNYKTRIDNNHSESILYFIKEDAVSKKIYYLTEGGYVLDLMIINADLMPFFGNRFIDGYLSNKSVTIDKSKVQYHHLKTQIGSLVNYDNDLVKGEGVVLYNDNDELYFEGKVGKNLVQDDGFQKVPLVSPIEDDLNKPIIYSGTGEKASEIIQNIMDDELEYLYGTITATTDTYDTDYKGKKFREIIEDFENKEYKIFRTDIGGDSDLITPPASGVSINADNGDCEDFQPLYLGLDMVGFYLRGGIKADGNLAEIVYYDIDDDQQQKYLIIVNVPEMIDDVESVGHEMYDYAVQLTSNYNNDIIYFETNVFNKGILEIGKTYSITNSFRSISTVNYILFKFEYDELADTCKCGFYSHLYFKLDEAGEQTLPEANRQVVAQISERFGGNEDITAEPTGFPNRTDSAMSMSTNNFQITVVSGSYFIKTRGIIKTIEVTKTIDLSGYSIGDTIYIQFNDNTQTLVASTTFWVLTDGKVQVAMVYKRTSDYVIFDERHGLIMDGETHAHLHLSFGAQYMSGFGLAATVTKDLLSINSGKYRDEDIIISIGAQTSFRVWYKDVDGISGAANEWMDLAPDHSFYMDDGAGDVEWNDDGTLTAASNNYFVNYWIFGTNQNSPLSVSIMGRSEYAKASEAHAEAIDSLGLSADFQAEFKSLFKITLKNSPTVAVENVEDIRKQAQVGGTASVGYTDAQAVAAGETAGFVFRTGKSISFADNAVVIADVIRDEDDMVSDDVNALATQQSIKAYTDTKLAKSGGTMSGTIDMSDNLINNTKNFYCEVYIAAGSQSIPDAAVTSLQFTAENSDSYGMHSNVTNNSRVTIPTGGAGYYMLAAQVRFASNATGERICYFVVNNANITSHRRDANATEARFTTSYLIYLSVGDYVELDVYQNSGAPLNIVGTGNTFSTRFKVIKLS